MTYLLDTNTCIAIINGRPSGVRRRLEQKLAEGGGIAVSSIVLFELWFGVAKSAPDRRQANQERLEVFTAGPIQVLDFELEDARCAGEIREALRRAGTPIGAYDLLIAGQAAARDLVVVTSNRAEFGRVEGLSCEDWAAI